MELKYMQEILNVPADCISVNTKLANRIGVEPALVYEYLLSRQLHEDEFSYSLKFDGHNYFSCGVEEMRAVTSLTPFKQRQAINILTKEGLICVKFGHMRARYIYVYNDYYKLQEMLMRDVLLSNNENIYKYELFSFLDNQMRLFEQSKNTKINSSTYKELSKYWNVRSSISEKFLINDSWKMSDSYSKNMILH